MARRGVSEVVARGGDSKTYSYRGKATGLYLQVNEERKYVPEMPRLPGRPRLGETPRAHPLVAAGMDLSS